MGQVTGSLQKLGSPRYPSSGVESISWCLLDDFAAWKPGTSFAELSSKFRRLFSHDDIPDAQKAVLAFLLTLLGDVRADGADTAELTLEEKTDLVNELPLLLAHEQIFWPLLSGVGCFLMVKDFGKEEPGARNEDRESAIEVMQPIILKMLVACMLICPVDFWIQELAERPGTIQFLPLDAVYVLALRNYIAKHLTDSQIVSSQDFLERALPQILDLAFGTNAMNVPASVSVSVCSMLGFVASISTVVRERLVAHPTFFDVLLSFSLTGWCTSCSVLPAHIKQCHEDLRMALLLRGHSNNPFSRGRLPRGVFNQILLFLTDINAPGACRLLLSSSSAAPDISLGSKAEAWDLECTSLAWSEKLFNPKRSGSAGSILPEDCCFLHLLLLIMLSRPSTYCRFRQCNGLQAVLHLCEDEQRGPFAINFLSNLLLLDKRCLPEAEPIHPLYQALRNRIDCCTASDGAEWGDATDAFAKWRRSVLVAALETAPFTKMEIHTYEPQKDISPCTPSRYDLLRNTSGSSGHSAPFFEMEIHTYEPQNGISPCTPSRYHLLRHSSGSSGHSCTQQSVTQTWVACSEYDCGDASCSVCSMHRDEPKNNDSKGTVDESPTCYQSWSSVDSPLPCEPSSHPFNSNLTRTISTISAQILAVGQAQRIPSPLGDLSGGQLIQLGGLICGFYLLGDAPAELSRFRPDVFPVESDDERPRRWTPVTHPGQGSQYLFPREESCSIL